MSDGHKDPPRQGRGFLSDTMRNGAASIAMFTARFITLAILARVLGVEGFGVIALAILCADLMTMLALGGLPGVVSRFLPQTDARTRPGFLALRLRWIMLSLGFIAVAAPLVAVLVMELHPALAALFTLWVALGAVQAVTVAEMQGALRFDLVFRSYLVGAVVQVIGALALTFNPSLTGAMLVLTVPLIFQILPWALVFRGRFQGPEGSGTLPALRQVLSYGLNACIIAALTAFVWSRGELLVVKSQLGDTTLGLYSAAVTLSAMVWRLTGLLQGAVTPHLARRLDSPEGIGPFVTDLSRLTMMLSTIGALGIALFSGELVFLVFGADFAETAQIVTIMTPGIAMAGNATAMMGVQLMSNGRVPRNALAAGGAVLILGAFLLAGAFGGEGVAVSRTVTMLGVAMVMPLWLIWCVSADVGRGVLVDLLASALVVGLIATVMLLVPMPFWARVMLWGCLAYLWAARCTGAWHPAAMLGRTLGILRAL